MAQGRHYDLRGRRKKSATDLHETLTSTPSQRDMQKARETFHRCATLHNIDVGTKCYKGYRTWIRPIYPHISEFDPPEHKNPLFKNCIATPNRPNHWPNCQKNAFELQYRCILSDWRPRYEELRCNRAHWKTLTPRRRDWAESSVFASPSRNVQMQWVTDNEHACNAHPFTL